MTDSSEEASYECRRCKYSTNELHHLEDHVIAEHGEPGDEADDGEVSCEKCDYIGQNMSSLRQHVGAVHDQIKDVTDEDVAREDCELETSGNVEVKATKKRKRKKVKALKADHDTMKNYPCNHCEYRASRKFVLEDHIKGRCTYDVCSERGEGVGRFLTKGREVAWIWY